MRRHSGTQTENKIRNTTPPTEKKKQKTKHLTAKPKRKKQKRSASTDDTWVDVVVELLPLVEPDLGQAGVVVVDNATRPSGERVGGRLAEHVADVRAGRYFQGATAHPYLPHRSERVLG